MTDEIKEAVPEYFINPIHPPSNVGDVRRHNIDVRHYPFSAQPMTDGSYCVFGYLMKGCPRLIKNVSKEKAYRFALKLNNSFWAKYK